MNFNIIIYYHNIICGIVVTPQPPPLTRSQWCDNSVANFAPRRAVVITGSGHFVGPHRVGTATLLPPSALAQLHQSVGGGVTCTLYMCGPTSARINHKRYCYQNDMVVQSSTVSSRLSWKNNNKIKNADNNDACGVLIQVCSHSVT